MLSQLLIAYTYDFDAEMAHELDKDGWERPPSLAMCANVLQFVGDEGLAMADLLSRCGIVQATLKTMLDCLKRHAWITIENDRIVRLTQRGTLVRRAFRKTQDAVERRWQSQLGAETVIALRAALEEATQHLPTDFPQYPMPAAHRGGLPRGE
jgi:predicted transcriptional regulator